MRKRNILCFVQTVKKKKGNMATILVLLFELLGHWYLSETLIAILTVEKLNSWNLTIKSGTGQHLQFLWCFYKSSSRSFTYFPHFFFTYFLHVEAFFEMADCEGICSWQGITSPVFFHEFSTYFPLILHVFYGFSICFLHVFHMPCQIVKAFAGG